MQYKTGRLTAGLYTVCWPYTRYVGPIQGMLPTHNNTICTIKSSAHFHHKQMTASLVPIVIF